MAETICRMQQFRISIGGIIIKFVADDTLSLKVTDTHSEFLVDEGEPNLTIKVHYGDVPDINLDDKLFDVREFGGVWALYHSSNNLVLTLTSPVFGKEPYRVAVFDPEFVNGDLYIRQQPPTEKENDSPEQMQIPCFDPTSYPFDEVVFVNLLSKGYGIDLHACGIKINDTGILFSGVSGAGKSTMANMWKQKGVNILSDDRIIVRCVDDHVMMFGTPWHGDSHTSLPEKAELKAIYFLKQSQENRVATLGISEGVYRLMLRSFPTYYSKEGMENTLNLISDLVTSVPCYELEFTPDEEAINTVLNHVNSIM